MLNVQKLNHGCLIGSSNEYHVYPYTNFLILYQCAQQWRDYRLQWEPEEYGGITKIKVPNECLWIPDILLYNK